MTDRVARGLVFDIQRYSIHDGPGIRTVVFLKGCPLRCKWCCNPESLAPERQLSYMPDKCIGCGACVSACPRGAISARAGCILFDRSLCTDCGACVEVCYPQARLMSGREMTAAEVLAEVGKDRRFYERSGGGLTLSGGECTLQWDFSAAVLRLAQEKGLHTAIETTGFASWEHLWAVAEHTDLLLYDLKHMDDRKHQEYTGVGNGRILSNLRRLLEAGKQVVIRIPLIPGHNDDPENLEATARFLKQTGGVREVDILPYHQLGMAKYPLMGYSYALPDAKPPTGEGTRRAEKIFQGHGFQTKING